MSRVVRARNTIESVLARFDRSAGEDGCWPWTGPFQSKGYGRVRVNGRDWFTHRLVAEHFHGPVAGRVVRHSCDNPPCGNPRHLLIGTCADNRRDMLERGRDRPARGEAHGNVKLTEADVRAVRRALREGQSQSALARSLGVSPTTLSAIAHNKTWAWLPDENGKWEG